MIVLDVFESALMSAVCIFTVLMFCIFVGCIAFFVVRGCTVFNMRSDEK